ncbi:LAME_0D05116g1_1 [Lachancea meyersii CBS 8951]|uniref:Enolase-phosphatase E1 n=1 Tax=Lachancea meyersii CBS 8951 TaxID=1266667 RepID=A0A1G4J8I6_9SACH|nr:LAME_0D05116g1_1 [Lachancea meyersii CBS 8951]
MTFSALVLDIEGTVCPISFVKETLFPYFLQKVDSLPRSEDTHIQSLLQQFKTDDVVDQIRSLVSRDVKDPILKELQGLVWQHGYASGEITAPVYADAVDFIEKTDKPVYIYSSGSVKAQKLLFQYVKSQQETIDLRPRIQNYYDINTSGIKTDAESYVRIAKDIGLPAGDILFLSDNSLELKAAQHAGFQVRLAIRPGNLPVDDQSRYSIITDFSVL